MLASVLNLSTAAIRFSRRAAGPHPETVEGLKAEPGLPAGPLTEIEVNGGRVELWVVGRLDDAGLALAARSLTAADRAERDRIRHPAAHARFIAARAALRAALSHAVGGQVPAGAWRFTRNASGKPSVGPDLPTVHFSISHGDSFSVIAVSRENRIGIDIESFAASMDRDFVASFLSRRELKAMQRLPQTERQYGTIRSWTLKEAYAKLLGIGLAADLQSFEFHLDPARLMSHCEAAEAGSGTTFRTWQMSGPGGSHHVALAVSQPEAARIH